MNLRRILAATDHTQLSPTATAADIARLCAEAARHQTASVCVAPARVCDAKAELERLGVLLPVCTVIGFPNGYATTAVKVFETEDAVRNGADEIDMVIDIGMVKERDYGGVLEEIQAVRRACQGKILKVIIETCLLTDEEKVEMCRVVTESGADYIKTSTGFASGGATFADVKLMREHVGAQVKVKAAGGISSAADAERFIELGADRLGTSRLIRLLEEA